MVLLESSPNIIGIDPQSHSQDDNEDYYSPSSISPSTSKESFDRDAFYDRLISEAPYIPGDKCELVPVNEIPWANDDLLNEGLKFARRNVFAIMFANTAALIYGFSVKPESVVLLRSGRFHRAEDSFLRYLSTAKRIGSWFISGLKNTESEGYKNIKIVRSMHSHYAKSKAPFPTLEEMDCTPDKVELAEAIRADLDFFDISNAPNHLLTWDPPLPFSQFDMAMTQFGFIAIVYLYPNSIGVNDYDLKWLDGFMHFWAIVGRMLGLEDRFNLALNPDRELLQKIYMQVGMASLKSTDETVICLQHSLIEGLSRRLPVLSLKSWIYYGLMEARDDVWKFQGNNIWKLMNYSDKFCYYTLKWSCSMIQKNSVVRFFANIFSVLLLHLAYMIYLPKSCPYSEK